MARKSSRSGSKSKSSKKAKRKFSRHVLPNIVKKHEVIRRVKRPVGVTAISVVGFTLSLLMLFAGILVLQNIDTIDSSFAMSLMNQLSIFIESSETTEITNAFAVFPIGFGIIGMASFFTLYRMKKRSLHTISVIGLLTILAAALTGPKLLIIVVWIVVLFYLWRRRELFE